jgi:outer membrane protein TolC
LNPPAPPPSAGPGEATETLGVTLAPGQKIDPIDLTNVLRLGGDRELDIAIARQRVFQAIADLSQARALWLPSLFLGPTWYRADGRVQTINGPVENVNRNSLFIGALAASPNNFAAASPGTGYPPLNGFSSVLRFSDAIYEPMAARRLVTGSRAAVNVATNDALLAVAEAYFDLQLASGRLAIAREAVANATALANITESYVRAGEGLEADHRRALAELRHQRKNAQFAGGQLLVQSADLVRLLVLNPRTVLAPVEPAESIVRMIPDEACLDDLIVEGLRQRPELARSQAFVQATLIRVKQARLRPFVPSLALSTDGGGFGGGQNAFFGNFGPRGDTAASLFWELQNLGFTDRAIYRRRRAENRAAELELLQVETQVAADVVQAYEARLAASRQIAESSQTVVEALESLQLNFLNIRQGAGLPSATRPIEVLQPIQALAQARLDYLESVIDYNRSQFRLRRAIGLPCSGSGDHGPAKIEHGTHH